MNESIHGERTASDLQDRLTELIEQQSAISEVLRAIASSQHDLQPIFDTILDHAARLCRAEIGSLMLFEQNGYRMVARAGLPDQYFAEGETHLYPFLPDGPLARLIEVRAPVHIAEWATDQTYVRRHPAVVAMVEGVGAGSALFVPMLTEDELVGAIAIIRVGVKPFADAQIGLVTDFAAQATIALESTRRERQYREMQSELAQANRVLTMGQLSASIAHELKQPLSAAMIGGGAGLRWLTRHPPDIERAKQTVEQMVEDVNRASVIIGRIHSLLKKEPPRMEKLDINGAILEVISLIHSEVVKNGVTVRTELAESLPSILGDRVQLQQVILNISINAIQAMGDFTGGNRELHVSTELTEPESVRVAVQDTGPGLSAENLEQLFRPFYTTKPNGMGMGLSICRSIIEDHGGRLWATRHDPHGALFQFTIPVT